MAIHTQCHLIVITGGKGGVGKSVFAANLAIAFQIELRQPVLLIDCDSKSCGDQNVLMGLKPIKNINEFSQFSGVISPQTLPQLLPSHQTGVSYLGAVRGPEENFSVDPDLFGKQLDNLSRLYKFIVVDIGEDYGQLQMNMIMEASALMMLTVPEMLVVNQAQKKINDLLSKTVPFDLMQLIINKIGVGNLSPQVISQSLRLPILSLIPSDDITVQGSIQRSTPFVFAAPQTPVAQAYHDIVRKLTGGVLQRLKGLSRPKASAGVTSAASGGGASAGGAIDGDGREKIDPRTILKLKVHSELIKAMDLKKGVTDTQGDPAKERALQQKTLQAITIIVDRESPNSARDERSRVIKEVLDEALGLGPLEDLLVDPSVTEVMVNGHKRIFVERSGRVSLTPVTFTSNLHLRNVIERIVTPLGRRIDEKTPYVDARLKDGSRVNAIIEPLSIDGPALTIRKFKKGGINPEKYIEYGSITKPMIDFLKICVENGLNVVISGGTGSGKTSLLNMLSSFIPSSERVVTVEDAAELQLQQEHVVRLETRPANMEGTGSVTIRDLIKNALRMRPDRIVVGECRDGAALDMLQAMNTGHDGSMTTTHANSPRECISRLETLCLMAGMDLPARAIREQISNAVNLIVQISRLSDGSRKILSLTEVSGMQGDVVTLAEIFRFKETGYDKNRKIQGTFQVMGHIPTFVEKLEAKGVVISRDIFSNDPKVQSTGPVVNGGAAGVKKPGMPVPPPPGIGIKKTS
jgi:septum site-determining protein MinD